ncbi:MAG: hypothetical protein OEZ21_09505 [Candidatus Bathyarchaeota archaeon]|nr:hypothetical protein [Candidatus Bathyarchaeota archaeon]MDH5747171.1 hypothetical protein [Candidatus Bathyarchaeota archaeon]
MSRKVKKKVSSLPYSINRFYRKISTAKPSTLILSAIAIAIAVFLFGGGLYTIIMKPLPSVYYGGRFLFLYPQLSEQFVTDSVIAMILYSLGIIGLILMYQSTKYAYKTRQAYMMFVVGTVLIFIAYILLETTINIKLGG